jgi:hypothetical protein
VQKVHSIININAGDMYLSLALTSWLYIYTHIYIFELGYNVMRGTEYFVLLQTNIIVTEEYNVMVNRGELIGTTNIWRYRRDVA